MTRFFTQLETALKKTPYLVNTRLGNIFFFKVHLCLHQRECGGSVRQGRRYPHTAGQERSDS